MFYSLIALFILTELANVCRYFIGCVYITSQSLAGPSRQFFYVAVIQTASIILLLALMAI